MHQTQEIKDRCYCCLSLRSGALVGMLYGVSSSLISMYNLYIEALNYPDIVDERIYFFKLPGSDVVYDASEIFRITAYCIGLLGCYHSSQNLLQVYIYLRCAFLSYSPYLLYELVTAVIDQGEEEYQGKALTRGPMTTRKLCKLSIFAITTLTLVTIFLGVQVI
ncbi:hypothetical protein PS15m_009731 [Mucor circinelloides]